MSEADCDREEVEVEICNKRGLHARASAKFVRLAETFKAEISVSKDGIEVCGTSIMGLMLLAAAKGETIRVSAQGPDAAAAMAVLTELIEARFEEDQ